MNQNGWSLIGFAAVALIVVGGLAFLSQHYTLDNIKSKTVGDGQYGTARWATKREVQKTYRHVPFRPHRWRRGKQLPKQQGLVLGSVGRKNHVTALVDCDDIHCLMIGASGVGKTAFFLYPNLEYACASGMSYLALDTKGDLARNYGAVASKYYGYQVSVIDLRNPTRSDGNNLLTLINRYMDLAREHSDSLTYKARAEIVRHAQVYRGAFAIAVSEESNVESPTVVGAQAANELLNIVGIKASFVLTEYQNKVYISSRSIDEIDVQLIMERLGGGGHLNVAGAQIENSSLAEVKRKLQDTIDILIDEGEIKI